MIRTCDALGLVSIDFDGQVMEFTDAVRAKDTYAETLESVKRYGVQSPILIRFEVLCNGHHRVVACLDLGIEEIPFTDDPEIGWANEFEWPEEKEACRD
jgi:hypothetical protein